MSNTCLKTSSAMLLRNLSKITSRARAVPRRTITNARAPQQQGGTGVQVQQQGQPPMRGVARNLAASPFSLTRELAPILPPGIGSLFRDLERAMEDSTSIMTPKEREALAPFISRSSLGAVDVKETDTAYEFDVDIPGLTKDEVQVMVNRDGVLTIKGERKFEEAEGDDNSGFRRVERAFGEFVRRFQLPDNTDPEHISAKVENGVLKVIVPKTKEEHGPAVSQIKVE